MKNNLSHILFQFIKYIALFIIGGCTYMVMEIFYRGYTHWTMGILGGICLILIGILNEIFKDLPLLYQGFMGSLIITILEYYSGVLLNIKLGLDIWNYSHIPWNVDGQVCLPYSILWIFVGIFAVILDDSVRYLLFNEEKKKYKLI